RLESEGPVQVWIYDAANRLVGGLSGKDRAQYRFSDKINTSAGLYTFIIQADGKTTMRRLVVR
ncbi:MAG TPA: T9SS type A sorting domain-containing protein, partial [Chitinophagaceae bacterium]